MSDRTNKNKIVGNLTVKSLERVSVAHRHNSDIDINKSDLIIYLGHYKNSIENNKKDGIIITLVNVSFVWSIFFTSAFSSVGVLEGNYIRIIYIIFATIITYDRFTKTFKKDNSKYKESDSERMVDIIENNCKKK
jgi:hypothetical protein